MPKEIRYDPVKMHPSLHINASSCVGEEGTWTKSGLSLNKTIFFTLRSLATCFLQRDIPNPLIRGFE